MTTQSVAPNSSQEASGGILSANDVRSASRAYSRTMISAVRRARRLELPQPRILSFRTCELTNDRIKELSSQIPTGGRAADKGSSFLYLLRLSESNRVPVAEAINAFRRARDYQCSAQFDGKKSLCKCNYSKDTSEEWLYVGRSLKPRERFKQHLDLKEGGTYAIHFQTWATELDLHVEFHLYQLRNVDSKVVQVIEDGLWDHFRPMLGRRGEK